MHGHRLRACFDIRSSLAISPNGPPSGAVGPPGAGLLLDSACSVTHRYGGQACHTPTAADGGAVVQQHSHSRLPATQPTCPPRPASVLLGHPLMRLLGNVSPLLQASTCHGWMCQPLTLAAHGQLQRQACSPTCSRCAQASRQHIVSRLDLAGQATCQPSHVHGCSSLAATHAMPHSPLPFPPSCSSCMQHATPFESQRRGTGCTTCAWGWGRGDAIQPMRPDGYPSQVVSFESWSEYCAMAKVALGQAYYPGGAGARRLCGRCECAGLGVDRSRRAESAGGWVCLVGWWAGRTADSTASRDGKPPSVGRRTRDSQTSHWT